MERETHVHGAVIIVFPELISRVDAIPIQSYQFVLLWVKWQTWLYENAKGKKEPRKGTNTEKEINQVSKSIVSKII